MNTNLSRDDIEKLASGKTVKRIAVENFLGSLTTEGEDAEWNAYLNLDMDSRLYKWNIATRRAIKRGIKRTFLI